MYMCVHINFITVSIRVYRYTCIETVPKFSIGLSLGRLFS